MSPYASNKLPSTDVGSCRPLVPHLVGSRSTSQGSDQRLMLLRCLIISRLGLGVGMKQIRGVPNETTLSIVVRCASRMRPSRTRKLWNRRKTPKTAHETRQLKPRLRQCSTLAISFRLLRRRLKCNFCIHTTVAKCIFHVDRDDLCVKITEVGYVGKETSRNTNRIFLASAKTGHLIRWRP
jgi:hypothetical protein